MEYQVAIIGGGPAGYTAAEAAGKAGMSVILFEKEKLGGVCLNEGCIPTKTLLYSAKIADHSREGAKFGVKIGEVEIELPKLIARKSKVVRKLALGIKAKLEAVGVIIVNGEATIVDSKTVECNDQRYSCEKLIIAAGSKPFIPPISGIDNIDFWTNKEALENKEIPQSMIIIGGGVIGMEFASFFNSLGTETTVIEMMDEILGPIDNELSALLRTEYTKRGVKFILSAKVCKMDKNGDDIEVTYTLDGEQRVISANRVMISVGRKAIMDIPGIDSLNLKVDNRGAIIVDKYMQTSSEGVYACGDINGRSMLAHTAVREAEVAVAHILGKEDEMSYNAIPSVVYTNPELSSIGKSEEELIKGGIDYKAIKLPMAYSGRFVAENEGLNGMCKLLIDSNNNILGIHILGNPSSEFIVVANIAIEQGMKLDELKRYIFPHPTVSEILREL